MAALKKGAKQLLGSVSFGALITILPFVCGVLFWADWFESVIAFIDWPMLVIQSFCGRFLPGNAGERVITFVLVNIISWTLVAYLATTIWNALRRMTISRRLHGN